MSSTPPKPKDNREDVQDSAGDWEAREAEARRLLGDRFIPDPPKPEFHAMRRTSVAPVQDPTGYRESAGVADEWFWTAEDAIAWAKRNAPAVVVVGGRLWFDTARPAPKGIRVGKRIG